MIPNNNHKAIAIIGMECLFPGGANVFEILRDLEKQ